MKGSLIDGSNLLGTAVAVEENATVHPAKKKEKEGSDFVKPQAMEYIPNLRGKTPTKET